MSEPTRYHFYDETSATENPLGSWIMIEPYWKLQTQLQAVTTERDRLKAELEAAQTALRNLVEAADLGDLDEFLLPDEVSKLTEALTAAKALLPEAKP